MSNLDKAARILGKISAIAFGIGMTALAVAWLAYPGDHAPHVYELEDRIATVEMQIEDLREQDPEPETICLDASDTPQCVPVEEAVAVPAQIELPEIVVTPEPIVVKDAPARPAKARRVTRSTTGGEPFHTYWGF